MLLPVSPNEIFLLETLLPRGTYPDCIHRSAQFERQFVAIQTASREFIRLRYEGLFESVVLVWWDLPPDAGRLAHLNQVRHGIGIDCDLADSAYDFRRAVLIRSHHLAAVEVGGPATVELGDANAGIHVTAILQLGAQRCGAHRQPRS